LEKRYFTMAEAAKYLTITRVTLHRFVKGGEIASYKIGTRRIFDKIELDKWVHSKKDKIKKERR
jgi:excisionase family DNA binding protein